MEYDVQIKATVIKTIRVEADNETDAIEFAHESFTTHFDGPEDYDQETCSCQEVTK